MLKVANFNVHLIKMPGGKYNETSSNIVDGENDDKGVQANFDIARKISESTNPITNQSGMSGSGLGVGRWSFKTCQGRDNLVKVQPAVGGTQCNVLK